MLWFNEYFLRSFINQTPSFITFIYFLLSLYSFCVCLCDRVIHDANLFICKIICICQKKFCSDSRIQPIGTLMASIYMHNFRNYHTYIKECITSIGIELISWKCPLYLILPIHKIFFYLLSRLLVFII